MRQNKIFPADWMRKRPYEKADSVDLYYVKVANDVLKILDRSLISSAFSSPEDMREAACCIAAWLEDLVSNMNIWYSFMLECKRLYGKQLPFVPIDEDDDYWEGDPNPQDVIFLLWHLVQQAEGDELFVNPENPGIEMTACEIFELLDERFQTAPENERLKDFLTIRKECRTDFMNYRKIIDWLHFDAYPNLSNNKEYIKELEDLFEMDFCYEDYTAMAYAIRCVHCMQNRNSILAWTTPEWYAHIAMEDDPSLTYLQEFRILPEAYYLYKSQDENSVYVTNLISGEEYTIVKESVKLETILHEPDRTVWICVLVWYDGRWWQNGAILGVDIEYVPEERLRKAEPHEKEAYKTFMKASKGERLMYFSTSDELNHFLEKSMKYTYAKEMERIVVGKGIILSATEQHGFVLLNKLIECINDPRNSFYEKEKAKKDAFAFYLRREICPLELLLYLHEKDYLSDAAINSLNGEAYGREFVKKNWDFMVRYSRREIPLL